MQRNRSGFCTDFHINFADADGSDYSDCDSTGKDYGSGHKDLKTKDAAENSHDYGDPKRGFNYIVGGVKGPLVNHFPD